MNESDLQKIWSQVRRKHFYPELPDPISVESVESREPIAVNDSAETSESVESKDSVETGDSVDSEESVETGVSNASSVTDVALEIKSKRISLS